MKCEESAHNYVQAGVPINLQSQEIIVFCTKCGDVKNIPVKEKAYRAVGQ